MAGQRTPPIHSTKSDLALPLGQYRLPKTGSKDKFTPKPPQDLVTQT